MQINSEETKSRIEELKKGMSDLQKKLQEEQQIHETQAREYQER